MADTVSRRTASCPLGSAGCSGWSNTLVRVCSGWLGLVASKEALGDCWWSQEADAQRLAWSSTDDS